VHAASLSERSAHSFAGKIAIAHLETLKKRCGANKLIAPLWLDMCHKHAVPLLPVFPQRLKLNFELVEYNLQMQHQALGVMYSSKIIN